MIPSQPDKTVTKVLDASRRKLVETGTRNRLIHVNRANQRSNALNIINERADAVYGTLRAQSRRMRFKAMGQDRQGDDADMVLALPDTALAPGADRQADLFLETPLGPEALARRLLRLALDARTAEEEQGLNILYLALGFLRWTEAPGSQVIREAPLLLLPVDLIRNDRTSTYDIAARDDDLTTNLPLQERLRQDFGISLPDIDEAEGWTPDAYFAAVSEAVAAQPGWSVDGDGMQLGFFSFAKLLMHRDLDPVNWPDGHLTGNDLLAGLLAQGFASDQPLFGPQDKLDALLDPADIIQVIDADASQTKVIEEVRRGASLVVQGPPGTGKSQTITNIIAAAAHDGKTVLFVAEKMAALSVVHGRLVKTGLRDICLELHSRTANKKALAQELGRTLSASAATIAGTDEVDRLRAARDALNADTNLLHDPLTPDGESPISAMAEIIGFMGKGHKPARIALDGLEKAGRAARQTAVTAIDRFVIAMQAVGPPDAHPFRGCRNLDLQPTDLGRLAVDLDHGASLVGDLMAETTRLAQCLGRKPPETLAEVHRLCAVLMALDRAPALGPTHAPALFDRAADPRLTEALAAGDAWQRAQQDCGPTFGDAAWSRDLSTLEADLRRGQRSFLARVFGGYRRASAELAGLLAVPLPKAPSDRLALIDRLAQVQRLRRTLADEEDWLRAALGGLWRGERTPFAALHASAVWLADLRRTEGLGSVQDLNRILQALPDPAATGAGLEALAEDVDLAAEGPVRLLDLHLQAAGLGGVLADAPLAALAETLARMRDATAAYGDWASLGAARAAAYAAGAGPVIEAITSGRLAPDQGATEFTYACAEARWNAARRIRPRLNDLATMDRHAGVATFRDLEKGRLASARSLILARHFATIPRGSLGEMGIIRGEIGRKRGHKSIRWVMRNAGAMVQRIKPVMLMSPISVAQFLPPGLMQFDLLVIDEASQIRPEDALGVVARARQIVVVGDQKQLPPTSFFDRLGDEDAQIDDEDADMPIGATAADMESILSLCEARGLRARMLEWHYRSRDPSLIRVSNAEFYGDKLVLPPSPLKTDAAYGLKFRRVPGVYARGANAEGRQGTNKIEAQAVVQAVAAHARDWPDLSLGVVAFSKAQADMLTEILEHQRRADPVLDAFLREGRQEDIFVKNIENVQGDERDVILISVGYGPQEPNGRLASMSFGPVNGEGGERRLNVLFSRARVRCEVFASFEPGDIDPSRSARVGPRVLKRFLDFAKTGLMQDRSDTGLPADSPFEEDVATAIRALGYEADPQVGTAGFRLDIGVRHPDRPGHYIVAVECDGAAYHSALWARERDRLRQDVLEGMGWTFHRIWSTDWFYHRAREITRLAQALGAARRAAEDGLALRGANAGGRVAPAMPDPVAPLAVDISHLSITAPPYLRSDITVRSTVEPHEAPTAQLADLVRRIVDIEGPLHVDELTRRVSAAFGKQKAGSRITEATERAVLAARTQDPTLLREGDFLLTLAQKTAPPIRDRSAETGSLLKAMYLPPHEIRAAATRILAESGQTQPEDLIRAVARLLGYLRVGPDLSAAISTHIPQS